MSLSCFPLLRQESSRGLEWVKYPAPRWDKALAFSPRAQAFIIEKLWVDFTMITLLSSPQESGKVLGGKTHKNVRLLRLY